MIPVQLSVECLVLHQGVYQGSDGVRFDRIRPPDPAQDDLNSVASATPSSHDPGAAALRSPSVPLSTRKVLLKFDVSCWLWLKYVGCS